MKIRLLQKGGSPAWQKARHNLRSVGSASSPRNQEGPGRQKQVVPPHPEAAGMCWGPHLRPGQTANPPYLVAVSQQKSASGSKSTQHRPGSNSHGPEATSRKRDCHIHIPKHPPISHTHNSPIEVLLDGRRLPMGDSGIQDPSSGGSILTFAFSCWMGKECENRPCDPARPMVLEVPAAAGDAVGDHWQAVPGRHSAGR